MIIYVIGECFKIKLERVLVKGKKDGKKVNDILKCQHLNAYRFAYNTFIDHSYPKVVTKLVFFAVYCNRFLHIIHVFSMLLYL